MCGDPKRIPGGIIEGYIDGLRVPGTVPHILAILDRWYLDMAALRAALPSLAAIPTLLIWGDRDRAVSLRSGIRLQRDLPQAELTVLPGIGHVSFEEDPEACNQMMRDWLTADAAHPPNLGAPSMTVPPSWVGGLPLNPARS